VHQGRPACSALLHAISHSTSPPSYQSLHSPPSIAAVIFSPNSYSTITLQASQRMVSTHPCSSTLVLSLCIISIFSSSSSSLWINESEFSLFLHSLFSTHSIVRASPIPDGCHWIELSPSSPLTACSLMAALLHLSDKRAQLAGASESVDHSPSRENQSTDCDQRAVGLLLRMLTLYYCVPPSLFAIT
jgi:hypothetical protein